MPFKSFSVVCGLVSLVVSAQGASTPAKVDFARDIAPLLKTHCFKCHTGDEAEAELDLDFKTAAEAASRAREDPEIFEKMIEVLRNRDMPPEDFRDQPTQQTRDRLIAWIEHDLLGAKAKSVRNSSNASAFALADFPARSASPVRLDPETKPGTTGGDAALSVPAAPRSEVTTLAHTPRESSPQPLSKTVKPLEATPEVPAPTIAPRERSMVF